MCRKGKVAHMFRIRHRDEVEPSFTDRLKEACDLSDVLSSEAVASRRAVKRKPGREKTKAPAPPGATRTKRP